MIVVIVVVVYVFVIKKNTKYIAQHDEPPVQHTQGNTATESHVELAQGNAI